MDASTILFAITMGNVAGLLVNGMLFVFQRRARAASVRQQEALEAATAKFERMRNQLLEAELRNARALSTLADSLKAASLEADMRKARHGATDDLAAASRRMDLNAALARQQQNFDKKFYESQFRHSTTGSQVPGPQVDIMAASQRAVDAAMMDAQLGGFGVMSMSQGGIQHVPMMSFMANDSCAPSSPPASDSASCSSSTAAPQPAPAINPHQD